MFNYNKDNDERMKILNLKERGSSLVYFQINCDTLQKLIDNNFANPEENQNGSPTISEFLEFGKKYKDEDLYFTGFAIPPERHDYSIVIEGMECETENKDFMVDFLNTFKYANKLIKEDDFVSCWYD